MCTIVAFVVVKIKSETLCTSTCVCLCYINNYLYIILQATTRSIVSIYNKINTSCSIVSVEKCLSEMICSELKAKLNIEKCLCCSCNLIFCIVYCQIFPGSWNGCQEHRNPGKVVGERMTSEPDGSITVDRTRCSRNHI